VVVARQLLARTSSKTSSFVTRHRPRLKQNRSSAILVCWQPTAIIQYYSLFLWNIACALLVIIGPLNRSFMQTQQPRHKQHTRESHQCEPQFLFRPEIRLVMLRQREFRFQIRTISFSKQEDKK
jgi:hypothetical protein